MDRGARWRQWRDVAAVRGQRVVHAGTHRLGIYRLTWATLVIAVLVVGTVPQIAALIPLPPRSGAEVVLTATAAFTACAYFVLWLCIFPIHAIPARLQAQAKDNWLARRTAWLDQHLGSKADRALDGLPSDRYWGLLLIPLFLILARLSWATPLATHLGVLAAWLLVRTRLDGALFVKFIAAPEDARDAARTLVDRGITNVLVTNAGGELLWNAQSFLPGDLPYRMYSTWATLQTVFAAVLAVATFDALSVLGLPWIRSKAIAALGLFMLAFSSGEPVGTFDASPSSLSRSRASAQEEKQPWVDQLLARIEEIPETQPALLIAASGGGSRAALLASLVFEELRLMPAKVAPGERARTLADNVLLISSVSGGSLATGYFLTLDPTAAKPSAQSTRVDPGRSRFVQSMATDFMAPLLRGVINLKQERGASVASFWNERFAWSKTNDAVVRGENRPLVVFNATAVKTGGRVGIGFPALPAGFHRSAIVPADINPNLRITLADAVRLSANFPYGFEYAVLAAGQPIRAKGAPIDDQVIDGGVVDNTGLDTLAMVMDALRNLSSSATDDPQAQATAAAYQRALDELRKRGMLLIEIDAGARPSPPTWPATSFSSLSKPVEAMGQAGHRNASILRQHNILQIRQALDEDEPVPAVIGAVRAGFDCALDGDVITAWALDHAAREQIYADFRRVEGGFTRSVELQLAAIARLHDARRVNLAKLSLSKNPVVTASDLRQRYETYLEQSMEVEAIEHANAPDCLARKRDAIKAATEVTLRSGIDEADYLVTLVAQSQAANQAASQAAASQVAASQVAAAQTAPPLPAAAKPGNAANAPTKAAPPPHTKSEVPQSVLGWIYLGNQRDKTWQTRNAIWNGKDRPKQGDIVELLGTSNVRASCPDTRGRLAPTRITLKPRTKLEIVETRDWADTGLIWAHVSTPSAATKKEKREESFGE